MRDGAHIRLTLTRGEKITSGMDPRLNQQGCSLIVLAEWKPPVYDNQQGIRLTTSSVRRNNPQFLDSKIHHNNLLNNILAKIEANVAGADDAVMLDAERLRGRNQRDQPVYGPPGHPCVRPTPMLACRASPAVGARHGPGNGHSGAGEESVSDRVLQRG
jgi:branched-chain amino acid aminotransferase